MQAKLQVKDKTEANKGFKADAFRKNIRKTTAHKHNSYFELVYLSKGKGTHTIDAQTYQVDVPVLFTGIKSLFCFQIDHFSLSFLHQF
jgi:AraC family transcriptional regulator, transcriptional activator of pobA